MCIQKLIEGERQIVDCPECRHITRIPKDGVDAMKTNLRLRNLAEKHDKHMTEKSVLSVTFRSITTARNVTALTVVHA